MAKYYVTSRGPVRGLSHEDKKILKSGPYLGKAIENVMKKVYEYPYVKCRNRNKTN